MHRSPLVLSLALCLVHCAHRPPQPSTQPSRPQVLDPLSDAERKTAEQAALVDPRVRELLGERGRLSYVEFVALKSGDETAPAARHAEVVFSRLDADYGVRAVVVLDGGARVLSVDRIAGENVPLTQADLEDARKLALQSAELRGALGARAEKATVEGLRILATEESDPCYHRRCLRLMFKIGRDYLSEPIVIVNLSTGSVMLERRPQ